MHEYNYKKYYKEHLTPEIVSLLLQIHEMKIQHNESEQIARMDLEHLIENAKIQSVESSNKIEGIRTVDERIKLLVLDKTNPNTPEEREIAGYRDIFYNISENYPYISPKPSVFLQFHRDLYKFCGTGLGGSYKVSDNTIANEDETGRQNIVFSPVPAWETSESVNAMSSTFEDALQDPMYDPLLLIPMFILDFLCIHPFNDGNGRMSRLLTLLLLYREGYNVGKYISIDKKLETSSDTYYSVLQNSSSGWHDNTNDYTPFVRYLLEIILESYQEFFSIIQAISNAGRSKPDRIRTIIRETSSQITKSEIMKKCPDISQITVQRALNDMIKSGEILKIGGGRYTSYQWNQENDK